MEKRSLGAKSRWAYSFSHRYQRQGGAPAQDSKEMINSGTAEGLVE